MSLILLERGHEANEKRGRSRTVALRPPSKTFPIDFGTVLKAFTTPTTLKLLKQVGGGKSETEEEWDFV